MKRCQAETDLKILQGAQIVLVASIGGHLQQILQLRSIFEEYRYVFITEAGKPVAASEMVGRTVYVCPGKRNFGNLRQIWQFYRILKGLRPHCIISTGAAPACAAGLVARFLGIRVLYIESFAAVERPTLTGRIMYYLATKTVYQWPALHKYFPKGVYGEFIYDFRDSW